jgi:hypothetical protein
MASDSNHLERALQENLKLRLADNVDKANVPSHVLAGRLRRGFFWLWIVLSVLWVAVVFWIALSANTFPSLTKPCSELLKVKDDVTGTFLTQADVDDCEAVWQNEQLKYLSLAFGPPLALLVTGLTVGWIANDFRRS